jgi:hypothetical protein
MKKYIPIILAVVILGGGIGYYVLSDKEIGNKEEMAEYKNDAAEFSFKYRTSPDGYVVIDQLAGAGETAAISAAVVIMKEADHAALQSETPPSEIPPTMSAAVINNPNQYSLQQWLEEQSGMGNLGVLFDTAEKVTVDGHEGIRVVTDGLYQTQMIVVTEGDKIYVFSGSYIDTESSIYKDFSEMLLVNVDIY